MSLVALKEKDNVANVYSTPILIQIPAWLLAVIQHHLQKEVSRSTANQNVDMPMINQRKYIVFQILYFHQFLRRSCIFKYIFPFEIMQTETIYGPNIKTK